jgi:hypothetical protein
MLHPSSFCWGQQPPIQLRALSLGPHIGLHADDGARRDRPYFGLQILTALRGPSMPASITGWRSSGSRRVWFLRQDVAAADPASASDRSEQCLRVPERVAQSASWVSLQTPWHPLRSLGEGQEHRLALPWMSKARKANDYFYACDRPTHRRLDEACLTGNRLRLDRCPATPSSAFFP